jgi:hypothetical protein
MHIRYSKHLRYTKIYEVLHLFIKSDLSQSFKKFFQNLLHASKKMLMFSYLILNPSSQFLIGLSEDRCQDACSKSCADWKSVGVGASECFGAIILFRFAVVFLWKELVLFLVIDPPLYPLPTCRCVFLNLYSFQQLLLRIVGSKVIAWTVSYSFIGVLDTLNCYLLSHTSRHF